MITKELINPRSIIVVGASNDISKPGGKILKNILDGDFTGDLYSSNPKEDEIQGVKSYKNLEFVPQVDLAILAVAARFCPDVVRLLAHEKGTRAFIIISAGFSEENEEGARLEDEIVEILEETGSCMIGPNCIGVINTSYNGCFTLPIPKLDPQGVDFVSASGATAVYVMEASIPNGLTYSSVYSVGNSAQAGVEDVLAYLDESYEAGKSSKVKLLYLEAINKPQKLLKHARSLIKKGCRIAAIKAGSSEAGSRAASSHTGALASPDNAVNALFEKAGIVRCYSREELAAMGGIFMHKELKGKNIAIITHAGGPAVMLTDVLTDGGMCVPQLDGPVADELLGHLHPGSSVSNPIDVLATGSVDQLRSCIEFIDERFDNIDGMVVIFGSPALFSMDPVYQLLSDKMASSKKPIFPVLPSIINAKEEIQNFLDLGRVNFPEEVVFGRALVKSVSLGKPKDLQASKKLDTTRIRHIIDNAKDGYLMPDKVQEILDAAGISRVGEELVYSTEDLNTAVNKLGFPLVMKVVGPVHKSDIGGVVLNVDSIKRAEVEFGRMMNIPESNGVLLQPQIEGLELFAGVKSEGDFGHLILFGMGGIFIEVFKDVQTGLAPLGKDEVHKMVKSLNSYPIMQGIRGQKGVDINGFEEIVMCLSALVEVAPEIIEMDLNPLIATAQKVTAVDARIKLKS